MRRPLRLSAAAARPRRLPGHACISARSRWLQGAATALVCLITASSASAESPTMTPFVDETPPGERIDLRIYDPVAFQCGTAHVELSYRDQGTLRVYYDNGEPIKAVRFVKGSGTVGLIDDATGDVLASESGASPRTEIYDLRADTYTVNGTTKHNNVPGLGRVTHASGSFTYELLAFDTSTLNDPAHLVFTTGELVHSSAKSTPPDPDWCAILQALSPDAQAA
jgi:hypothetical protein